MKPLLEQVRELVHNGADMHAGTARGERFRSLATRLDDPLRVAIAGRVKAGKSTLLNALVGERLAPTDAGECTKVVTWYTEGLRYRVLLEPFDGETIEVPFSREAGAISVDLAHRPAADVARLVVEWPSAALRTLTLIDTPGIASLSTDASDRTHAFLTPGDEQPTPADAVLYLMKHMHSSDARFLEAFHDEEAAQATPVNTVALLARADEVGDSGPDALEVAERIATRYRTSPQLRRLCQTVIPVSGLLAETGQTLTEAEFSSIRELAEHFTDIEPLLLSADRFVNHPTSLELDHDDRTHLLSRLGLFGLRFAIERTRSGRASTSGALAASLVEASGLPQLHDVLNVRFLHRRDALKARSVLLALQPLLHNDDGEPDRQLAAEWERVAASAHELIELRLLSALRSGIPGLGEREAADAERLLGRAGYSPHLRLGLPEDAPPEELRTRTLEEIGRWRGRAEAPSLPPQARECCLAVARTCEGIYHDATADDERDRGALE